jgi:putative transcriptional regulator
MPGRPKVDESVHNRIQLLRTERGMSRHELAEAVGVHYQTIGYLERGEYSPSLHLALRVSAPFGRPVEAIFSLAPFPPLTAEALIGRNDTISAP